MNIDTINEMIKELENSDATLSNIRNLSALYNVRKNLFDFEEPKTTKELSDILPSYLGYINIKRKYQRHETTEDNVKIAIEALCKEIKEFVQSLYSGTDTPIEREIIKQTIKEMQ